MGGIPLLKILIVDDDEHTRTLMNTILMRYGYETLWAENGQKALEVLDVHHVDLILLDVMMPEMDGYEFTQVMRDSGNMIPILMVSAKETIEDKKQGFLCGSDDYMVKPFDEEELLLRIKALLRRSKIYSEHRIVIGDTILDYDRFIVTCKGQEEVLPKKEFQLLYHLLSYPGKIMTRRQLMDEIWDLDSDSDERTVDVHIKRLRERFQENPDFVIQTIRGLGYKAVKVS